MNQEEFRSIMSEDINHEFESLDEAMRDDFAEMYGMVDDVCAESFLRGLVIGAGSVLAVVVVTLAIVAWLTL